jgi:putative membrane protein
MKKVFGYGIAVLALSAAPLMAQSGATGSSTAQQPRTGSTAGTTGSQSGTTTGTQGTATKSGSHAAMATSADHEFVMEAARGGLAEVELGKLASDKASSDQVKQFGQRMVTDHGKANDELKEIAEKKNITLPTDLSAKDKSTHDRLSKLSGAAFDRAYMQEMVSDHRKDVNEFRRESQSGKDPDVKAWAAKTLPTLEEHLKLAQTTSGAVGTSGKASSTPGAKSGTTGSSGTTPRPGSGSTTNPGSNNPRR